MVKKLKYGQHDPVHNWLDMAFRTIGGDKKAYKEWKEDRAEEIAWNGVHHYEQSNEPPASLNNIHIPGFPPQETPASRSTGITPYPQVPGRGRPQGYFPQRTSRSSASLRERSPRSYHSSRGAGMSFTGPGVQPQGRFRQHSQSLPNVPQAGRQSHAAKLRSRVFSQQPDPYMGGNMPSRRSSQSSSRRSQSFGQQQPPSGRGHPALQALSQRSLSMGQRPVPNPIQPPGKSSHSQRSMSSSQHQFPLGGVNHQPGRPSHTSSQQSVPINQYQGYFQASTTKAPSATEGLSPSTLGIVTRQPGPTMVGPTMIPTRALPTEQAEIGDMTRSFIQGMV